MPRLASRVKLAVTFKVAPLPLKVIAAGVASPGTAPRLRSAETFRVPPEIVTAQVKSFVPLKVNAEVPLF